MVGIVLAPRVRDNLYSLQGTQQLLDRTNSRLSTGLKVQTAVDNPVAYFKSQSLRDRAETFEGRKAEITQGIDMLKTTSHGLDALIRFLKSIKGQVSAIQGADSLAQFDAYRATFNEMITQYDSLAKDVKYGGQSLLASTKNKINVKFSNDKNHVLTVQSKDELANKIGLSAVAVATKVGFKVAVKANVTAAIYRTSNGTIQNSSQLDTALDDLDTIIENIKADAIEFGGKLSILNIRSDFTDNYVKDMKIGADDLVIADSQEEGAHMMALRTRQALALNSLSIAAAQDSNVLQLIGGR